jgi:hypothetical protein
MNSSSTFRISRPKVIDESFDGEVVVINFDTGSYYSLGGTAADIWSFIRGGAAAGQIVEALARRYDASRADIEAAVDRLIAELEQENLIVASTEPGPASDPTPADSSSSAPRPTFPAPQLEKFTDMQELILLDPIHEVDDTGWPNSKGAPRKNDE